jgi:hypothetical protein
MGLRSADAHDFSGQSMTPQDPAAMAAVREDSEIQ